MEDHTRENKTVKRKHEEERRIQDGTSEEETLVGLFSGGNP